MATDYARLKERQRAEREHHPQGLGLRVHRALSWLNRAEQCEDSDGQFVFLWIAFNAAYSAENGGRPTSEADRYRRFLIKLADLDREKKLHQLVWQQYPQAIRVLMDNPYVFQPFWDYQNGLDSAEDWEKTFQRDKQRAHQALAKQQTASVLSVVFYRLYTLRNQLIHGGATWNSQTNREQLRDATRLLFDLVPTVIELMLDHPDALWGDAMYPPVET
ncbi:MAG: hypothetical protein ACQES2_03565 [Pseudomonadota bacterium]